MGIATRRTEPLVARRRTLRIRLGVSIAAVLIGAGLGARYLLWMEPQVDDPGEYAIGTSQGAALLAGGVPEDVIRAAPECSGETYRPDCNLFVLAHSTPWEGRVEVGEVRALGGRWEGTTAEIAIGSPVDIELAGTSRNESWGGISSDSGYSDRMAWIDVTVPGLSPELTHTYVDGNADLVYDAAEHGSRVNTYTTDRGNIDRDLRFFVVTPAELAVLGSFEPPRLLSAMWGIGSYLTVFIGLWVAIVAGRDLRRLRVQLAGASERLAAKAQPAPRPRPATRRPETRQSQQAPPGVGARHEQTDHALGQMLYGLERRGFVDGKRQGEGRDDWYVARILGDGHTIELTLGRRVVMPDQASLPGLRQPELPPEQEAKCVVRSQGGFTWDLYDAPDSPPRDDAISGRPIDVLASMDAWWELGRWPVQ